MKRLERIFSPLVYWLLAGYILITFPILSLGDKAAGFLLPEDHYFENVGAASLFIASVLFFYCFLRSLKTDAKGRVFWLKRLVYLGLAMLFFFGAGEEISWGQRIFGYATPAALSDVNIQNELTLHNLSIFDTTHYFTVDRLFDIFWFLFAVTVPTALVVLPRYKDMAIRLMPVLPVALGGLFFGNYLLAKAAKLLFVDLYTYTEVPFRQAVQEIKESNYSLLFIFAGLYAIWELGRSIKKQDEIS